MVIYMATIIAGERQFDVSCVVLDKDGTLIDFDYTWGPRTADWIRALAEALPGEGTPVGLFASALGYDWARQCVIPDGPIAIVSGLKLVTLAAGVLYQQGLPWHQAESVAITTLQQTLGATITTAEIKPIGDVVGTIKRLRKAGILVAIATGDDRKPTEETLSLLGITDEVATIVCGDDPLPEKPDPAVLQSIGSKLGISTRHMLMVGDTINDMLAGQNAEVAGCIGITGSTGDPDGLFGHADVILTSIDQIEVSAP